MWFSVFMPCSFFSRGSFWEFESIFLKCSYLEWVFSFSNLPKNKFRNLSREQAYETCFAELFWKQLPNTYVFCFQVLSKGIFLASGQLEVLFQLRAVPKITTLLETFWIWEHIFLKSLFREWLPFSGENKSQTSFE